MSDEPSNPEKPAQYTCNEYRAEMILLGLNRRLSDPKLTEEQRQELRKEIVRVEKLVGL